MASATPDPQPAPTPADPSPEVAPAPHGAAIDVAVVGVWRRRAQAERAPQVEILIARRNANAILGGLWELPGGKVERGESVEAAGRREALEETGIAIDRATEVGVVDGGGRLERGRAAPLVRLHALVAEVASTVEAKPLASAECRWIALDDMDRYEWPEANRELNRLVRHAIEAASTATRDA
ncbi:MAG: NUDIX domain-containing protein [Phycisphaerae bacterium]|nr:NUDIX domain-containing protein [Phycisphaerae bacterium]